MKILLSHRYFWPDTPPYATMLRSIAGRLAEDGHDVTVFASQPSYHSSKGVTAPRREELDGFKVVRLPIFKERKSNAPLRAVNLLAYVRGLRSHILGVGDYDIVSASTFPPIAAGRVAAGAAKRTGARFIYHCMDIHPELSLHTGQLRDTPMWRKLRSVDTKTCLMAAAVVVLSQDMRDTLRARPGLETLPPKIINNFLLENFDETHIEGAPELPADKFTVLFAGNIGKFQNLDAVVAAADQLQDLTDVQFWFMGEGAAKSQLMEQARDLNGKSMFFLPQQSSAVAQNMMGKASLNLVSLAPDIFRVSYPSKTMVSLSRGTPVLAVIEPQSELARMVSDAKIGYTAPPSDPGAIAAVVQQAYQDRQHHTEMRSRTQAHYESHFAKGRILDRWAELMRSLQ